MLGEITLFDVFLKALLVIGILCLAVGIGLQTGWIFKKWEGKDDL